MTTERCRIDIQGTVQGVGFRPFVYRLARQFDLNGWVLNNTGGVQIEIQGFPGSLQRFIDALQLKKPAHADIRNLNVTYLDTGDDTDFHIRKSVATESPTAYAPPDLAPCEDCLQELLDPDNRRYQYPFVNCTRCGPRFSIIEALPYDRSNTTMKMFILCDICRHEYETPADRRFHAEPNACPVCGPQLSLHDCSRRKLAERDDALQQAAKAIAEGAIVALKGVGGFQLLADAHNEQTVALLRDRKQRPAKPFAVMYPGIDAVLQDCEVSATERELLLSPARPIVLLKTRNRLAPSVAPDNPNLGIMLPASPLHYLLMRQLQRPLIATSANLAEEPICYDNDDAFSRLGHIADLFLLHDRPIARPLDDSVLRVMDGTPVILRRARGYAPAPLFLQQDTPPLLATGGHLKNTVALAQGNALHISQHTGDLENLESLSAFKHAITDLTAFHQSNPVCILHDKHPGYASSQWALAQPQRRLAVQHHVAHFFACMAEHRHTSPALGIIWDGSGYGDDDRLWGGEFFHWDGAGNVAHVAGLRPFPLPGAEQAIREPRRQALGLLYAMLGDQAFTTDLPLWHDFNSTEIHNFERMLDRGLNTPECTSIGRLFDAVAALLGLAPRIQFEGQAAMQLEFQAQRSETAAVYPFRLNRAENKTILDWEPMISAILTDLQKSKATTDIAAMLHNTLAAMALAVARQTGERQIFLSGGVFQNRLLTETTTTLLRDSGYQAHIHNMIPPNDGGIAAGQIYYAQQTSCV